MFSKKVIDYGNGNEVSVSDIKSVEMIFLLMAILKTHGETGEVKISQATANRIAEIAGKKDMPLDEFAEVISNCKLMAEDGKRKYNRPVFSYVEVDETNGDVYFEISSAFSKIFDEETVEVKEEEKKPAAPKKAAEPAKKKKAEETKVEITEVEDMEDTPF